ncbi:MAG TPA: ankyrin repeat domain-containing protein [Bryobacteraceae bacterium]
MSDALALPPHPNVEQYRKLAKDFQKACKSGSPSAVHDWATRWVETLARLQGRQETPDARREIALDAARIERHWGQLRKSNEHVANCTLAGAQLLVARCHGFVSWPKFVKHLDAITRGNSPVSQFEAAVDAVVTGDIETLKRLLRASPELVRTRSTREHGSTLLHYVSANGVEDFRQKSPKNIVKIAKVLLESGADVNAESDAYGGRSTALGLTATSYHPDAAGVQLALMDLLITHGGKVDGPDTGSGVNACLHNGRGEAAEYLANRGARLDLEGAAGIGRMDVVKSYFDDAGRLKPSATREQLIDGFTWACEFGRNSVIEFLLGHGMNIDARLKGGETGLHWAAYEGHVDTVRLLLERGAPVNVTDETHGGTPLGWALYAWGNRRPRERERRSYYETVARLVRAGAEVDPRWFEGDVERERAAGNLRSDARMLAALRGETPQGETQQGPPSRAATAGGGTARVVQLEMKTPRDLTCAFSPDRTRAATGVVGRSVRVWNVETGECLAQLVGHTERIWGLAWSRDGQQILSGAWDNTARLWDVRTGRCVRILEGHSGFVRAVEFSADGRRAITAGGDRADRTVRVWDLTTGECLRVFEGHTAGAYCGLLASDGRRAVSGSRDGTVRVWDIETGRSIRVIEAHATHVQHLAWSRDEQRVLSCSLHIRLWDLESGRCLQTFEGHTETIRTVEWSPDQRLVLSASHDRTVRVWEAHSGRCVEVVEGHPTLVVNAAWSADQRHIISCDEDAQIRIWNWGR